MSTADDAQKTPFFLRGNYAPLTEEQTYTDLRIEGSIPPTLSGRYLRNGPNPKGKTPPHWFFGDGMLHGLSIREGRVQWYRNRWIRTEQLDTELRMVGLDGQRNLHAGPANTNIIRHAGHTLAVAETTLPWEVTEDLETVGHYNFGARLSTGMTAHPKICAATGEMHFFDYNWMSPFVTYHCVNATGELVRSVPIDVPGPTMMHDFAITRGHVLFMDLPVVFDFERAIRGVMPYRWDDNYGARIGVLARGATDGAVRWFPVSPCYVFHPMNAYEKDSNIVVDVARYPELWRDTAARFDLAFLHRWELNLESGQVRETALDDRPIEFPRIADHLTGVPHRFGYAVGNLSSTTEDATTILKYDLHDGTSSEHDFGAGRFPGEATFVADASAAQEDAGWLMTFVYDAATDRSDFVILDAQQIANKPVAAVKLPGRVPFGFHGNWFAD